MGDTCKIWVAVLTSIVLVSKVLGEDFMTNCPVECSCKWSSGNKKADCSGAHLQKIPKTLDSDIQILDLTGNDLYEISRHAFEDVQIINLKRLVLKECKLFNIHKDGLSSLVIMIELDLSKNDIITLHPDTFKETSKIRLIFLNDNRLEKLDDGLFTNLPFLQMVYLHNNNIMQIGVKTFINVPNLNYLRLEGNKLEHLKIETLNALSSLSILDIHDNPWQCDCYLQPFRDWVMSKKFTTASVSCAGPVKVLGKQWKELDSSDFVCNPSIAY